MPLVRCRLVACLAPLVLLGAAQPARAQDDMVQRRPGIVLHGRIVNQDATGIRILEAGTNREQFVPADKIERIELKLSAEQREGEDLYREKSYAAAVQRLRAALGVERRGWLRRRIGSEIVAASLALDDPLAAIDAFLEASQDPQSPLPWSAIPIGWLPDAPPAALRQRAAVLLREEDPLRRLIGASYLFGTEQSEPARSALTQLARHSDERLAALARTQLWRWRMDQASAAEIAGWESELDTLSPDTRGGPSFVLGLALERLGAHDAAALAFLRPALVLRGDARIARRSAYLAALALEREHPDEAKRLHEDVVLEYPRSTEAASSQARLETLGE